MAQIAMYPGARLVAFLAGMSNQEIDPLPADLAGDGVSVRGPECWDSVSRAITGGRSAG